MSASLLIFIVAAAACGAAVGQEGNELTVEFTVLGRPFLGLDGGPAFTPNEAVSFIVLTDDRDQTDRYWHAIVGNGGKESACGWCKDRWGHSWQTTPKRLMDLVIGSDRDKAKRAMEAMMTMKKIDIAAPWRRRPALRRRPDRGRIQALPCIRRRRTACRHAGWFGVHEPGRCSRRSNGSSVLLLPAPG